MATVVICAVFAAVNLVESLALNRGVSSLFLGGGLLLFISYLGWSVLESVGSAMAAGQALTIHGWAYSGSDPRIEALALDGNLTAMGWLEAADWSVSIESLPVGVAFGLVLLGSAFAAGERMQRDMEGLV